MARFRNNLQRTTVERMIDRDGLRIERVQRFDEAALLPETDQWRWWSFRITLGGTRYVCYQQRVYTLSPNMVLFNSPLRERVQLRSLAGTSSDIVVVSISPECWTRFLDTHPNFARHNHELIAQCSIGPLIARQFAPLHLLRVTRQLVAMEPDSGVALHNHAGLLLNLLSEVPFSGVESNHDHERRRVEAAQAHMVARLEQPPSLDEIAAQLNVSARQLQRDFLACTGMTPMRYLNVLRLSEANFLLAETALPVAEIAARLGYVSPANFSAAFRQMYGYSPRQVRTGLVGEEVGGEA